MAQWLAMVPQFAAGLFMLVVAGLAVATARRSIVAWAFAAVLAVRAGIIFVTRVAILATPPDGALANPGLAAGLLAVDTFLVLALAPAIAWFVLVHHRPAANGSWRILRTVLPATLVVMELAVAWLVISGEQCLLTCGEATASTAGPLRVMSGLGVAATGLAGLYFARVARQRPIGPLHSGPFLLAVGFGLNGLLDGGNTVLELLQQAGPAGYLQPVVAGHAWILADVAFGVLGFLGAAAALVLHGLDARANPGLWPMTLAAYAGAAWVLATCAFIVFSPNQPFAGDYTSATSLLSYFIVGWWRLALPAVAALAIVKHRLFGLELRLNRAVGRSLVAGAFLAVFFVVAQLIQNVVAADVLGIFGEDPDGSWGLLAGGVAAGLLLFAIHPLRNAGLRIADSLVPVRRDDAPLTKLEAVALYRQQALLVWSDGVMGRKERILLDQLRTSLRLALTDTLRIEREAAEAAPAGRFPRRKRAARRQALATVK